MINRAFAIVGTTAALTLPVQGQTQYDIDPVHSFIEFSVRHLGVSNVKGRFTKFSGTIWYNESDVTQSSATAVIEVASIDTAVPQRDEHLRSPDFFDAAKYPQIRFQSTSIRREGDKYIVKGNFEMHGVTKEIEIEATPPAKVKDPWGGERIAFEAHTTVNRQDFGISFSKLLDNGALFVGNDVKIELNIEAVRKTQPAAGAQPAKEAKPPEEPTTGSAAKKDS
jgi:polyisoprenoid-binding protein YceI